MPDTVAKPARPSEVDSYFLWEPPQQSISVLLNLKLLESLKTQIREAAKAGSEVGGILLGRCEPGKPGRSIITIDNCDLVESGHQRGPAYMLNAGDRRRFEKRLQYWSRKKDPRFDIVGFVRGHARTGLYLAAADFSIAREYFSDPASVFLLVRPDPQPVGGFFFWEDGDIHGQSSYLQFPFDSEQLERSGAAILRAPRIGREERREASIATPPMATPPTATPAQAPSEKAAPAAAVFTALPSAPPTAPPAPKRPLETAAPGRVSSRNYTRNYRWLPVAAALAGVALLPAWFLMRHNGANERGAGLRLEVAQARNALRLTWNPHSEAVESADHAELSIIDGSLRREMVLNPRQLARGYALYVPVSGDVTFSLEAARGQKRVAESIRSVSPAAPAALQAGSQEARPAFAREAVPEAAAPAQALPERPVPERPVPERQMIASAPRRDLAVRPGDVHDAWPPQVVRPKQRALARDDEDGDSETHTADRRKPPMAPAPALIPAPTPIPTSQPAATPPPQPAPTPAPQPVRTAGSPPVIATPSRPAPRFAPPTVAMFYEAAPDTIRRTARTIDRIPGVKLLHRTLRLGDEGFVAAKPVVQVKPRVPGVVARELPGEWRIDVKATVDRGGHVTATELLSPRADSRLAEIAASALDHWEFEPAQLYGRNVSSKVVVTFRFRNPPRDLQAASDYRR